MSNNDLKDPLIVRKNRSDDDDDHHGGVWKLAFADFMTAMMAFFLVMWLINSTTKETKAAIVQYFNPVQLIDSSPARKGLRDPKEGGQGSSLQQSEDAGKAIQAAAQQKTEAREASLYADPLTTLDDIAKHNLPPIQAHHTSRSESLTPPDPFERMGERTALIGDGREDPLSIAFPSLEATPDTVTSDTRRQNERPAPHKDESTKEEVGAGVQAALQRALRTEARLAQGVPRTEVIQTDEGVLISLTDDAKFSMFEIGSIEPKPQLVRILGAIGRALARQAGEVEIAGHTDGRSYKSTFYDNWRLSADRANIANYMLVRGGLPPTRIAKIVGYADRRLKNARDPLAAVNRRIDIFIRGQVR